MSTDTRTQHDARLYPSGDRHDCPLPAVGKYWGWRFGEWRRVEVLSLPERGGTGALVYAPRDRRGYPWHKSAALQDCQAFYGPVRAWGTTPPKVARQRLEDIGLGRFLPKTGRRRPSPVAKL